MHPNITTIKNTLDQLKSCLKEVNPEGIPQNQIPDIDPIDFIKSFRMICSDIKRLTSIDHLTVYFTDAEIKSISQQITNSVSHIKANQFTHANNCLNILRPLVRSYWIRNRSNAEAERYAKCEEKLADLEGLISNRNDLVKQLNQVSEQLKVSKEIISEIEIKLSQIETLEIAAETTKKSIDSKEVEVEESLAEINSKEEVIKAFAEKIAQRETQIENQAAATKAYENTLKKIEEEKTASDKKFTDYVIDKKQEIHQIIENAAEALNLRNAQGLSREFKTKADSLKPGYGISGNGANWWLIAAGIFVFGAIGLSIWLLLDGMSSTGGNIQSPPKNIWYQLVGRISMIGLLVTAAVFCARQFTKASRLFEDYAYRKIIIASLPGFLLQLEKMDETDSLEAKYLTKVLDEINIHPLRGAEVAENADGLNLTTSQLAKITEIVKGITK
jgi:hypothetical protein